MSHLAILFVFKNNFGIAGVIPRTNGVGSLICLFELIPRLVKLLKAHVAYRLPALKRPCTFFALFYYHLT